MVIHICCSVDSGYFLARIREKYPRERLLGFFYNPNIHPESEYLARLIDSKRSCDQFGIEFIEGNYDPDRWFTRAAGKEMEPEKGKRCEMCFDLRLEETAKFAKTAGEKRFSTTLLLSPKKDLAQLKSAAIRIADKYGAEFVFEDFRKGGGTQNAFAFAREKNVYFQNYCGCAWALVKQRAEQGAFAPELSSPIAARENSEENSADRRLKAIKDRYEREKNGGNIALIRRKVLNWRLLSALFSDENGAIGCQIAPYSAKINAKSKLIATAIEGLFRFEKQAGFAVLSGAKIADAENIRAAIGLGAFDITPIFIINRAPIGKVSAKIESVFYEEEELFVDG